MSFVKPIHRRHFLKVAAAGAAATLLAGCGSPTTPANVRVSRRAPSTGGNETISTANSSFTPDLEIALRAQRGTADIRAGNLTNVWTITGELFQGEPDALQPLPGSYLGPIIRARTGQKVRIHFTNELPEASILHWHGLHVPADMDGHPRFAIDSGQTYVYEFEVRNRAGTYWYHPHPHDRTGPQVYAGMAGLFLISDNEERSLGLPSGEYDIPLVIQDRTLDDNNQLVYQGSGMMDQMMGFLGQEIWVNGKPDLALPVATRAYRLRLLNGSISRIYKLGWDDNTPLTVIGTDGGLLESAVQRPYVMLAPGERVELWVDFSGRPLGNEITLRSLPFTAPEEMGGMMDMGRGSTGGMMEQGDRGGMMGQGGGGGMMEQGGMDGMMGRGGMMDQMMENNQTNAALPQGASFSVLTVRIAREVQETIALPARLSSINRLSPADATNASNPRTIALQMRMPGGWTLNGRTFDMTDVASDEIVQLGSTEVWEFINQVGGMGMMGGMMLPHPMHIHGESFQVLERQVDPDTRIMWETVSAGYVDEGWKDTVLVMPGERVKVLRRFSDYAGMYIYHCHNLEHEDMGMMRNFRVDPA